MSLPGYKLLTVSKYEICVCLCVHLLQHTWHMSLKRKFKTEHALLVDAEVRKYKEKYALSQKSNTIRSGNMT